MTMHTRRGWPALICLILLGSGAGPALAQPSDKYLERPPYYTGKAPSGLVVVSHFPVAYQAGGSHDEIFDPSGRAGGPVTRLVAEMNAYLASLGLTVALDTDGRLRGSPPDVSFGCELEPWGECEERDNEQPLGREGTFMKLGALRPSGSWREGARATMEAARVDAAVVITLEVGQYYLRQRGLRGDKWVHLGTGHSIRLPWLTSLETPVTVLQLTGALVDREGGVKRIGAEGFAARRTQLPLSSIGAQELFSDEDVEEARLSRRDDLPGRPLAWQEALRNLVENLIGARRDT